MSDDRDEIPTSVHDEIASWRRVINGTPAQDARGQLQRAAIDLFKVLLLVKTEDPAKHLVVQQAVVDAMQEFADFHQLAPDDALAIIAKGRKEAASPTAPAARAPAWRDHVVGARDLCDQVFPDIRFLVPGLFPEGVTLLVSRPKLGKSWLLLQIGSSIANGVSALVSSDEPVCGDVLYLSLEDGERRVQRRMTKHFGARRECWPSRLQIASAWRRLDQGGLQDVRDWCKSVAKPTLLMIDTLKKVRPPKKHGQSDYDADYEACEGLMQLAREFPGLAFIVAHHDRKMAAEDVFDTVSGTLGLTGGVDTIAILKRNGQGVTFHVQGRDLVDNVEKAVRFDRETCRWTILGEAAEVHRSGERTRVLDALRNGPLSVGEIMADAEISSRANADQILHRMSKVGEIDRHGRGRYALPGTPLSEVSESQQVNKTAENTGVTAGSDASDTPDRGSMPNERWQQMDLLHRWGAKPRQAPVILEAWHAKIPPQTIIDAFRGASRRTYGNPERLKWLTKQMSQAARDPVGYRVPSRGPHPTDGRSARAILGVFTSTGKTRLTAAEIWAGISPKVTRGAVVNRLSAMLESGLVRRVGHALYEIIDGNNNRAAQS